MSFRLKSESLSQTLREDALTPGPFQYSLLSTEAGSGLFSAGLAQCGDTVGIEKLFAVWMTERYTPFSTKSWSKS